MLELLYQIVVWAFLALGGELDLIERLTELFREYL